MPTDPVVADSALLTVQMSIGSAVVENVLGFHTVTNASYGTQEGYQLLSGWWACVRLSLPTALQCVGGVLRDLRVHPSIAYELQPPTNPAGTVTGTVAPLQATRLVRATTALGNRRGRGRIYLGPLTDAAVNGDGRTLTSSDVSSCNQNLAAALQTVNGEAAGFSLAVVSRTGGFSTPVTGLAVQPQIATQRRRVR